MACVSCKSEKTEGENPFFSAWETPYGVPPFDKIRAEHFLPALERGMSLHDAEIDAIASNNDDPTFGNVIEAYDAAGGMLARTELVFGMLCAAENTPELQALQERAMPLLAAHYDRILLDERLFARVARSCTTGAGRWIWTMCNCACWRRPTGASCAPGRCSTPGGRPA